MIYKLNRTDKQTTSGLSYFFKGIPPEKKQHTPGCNLSLFEAATKFYSAIPGNLNGNPMEFRNCFALTLARTVIDRAILKKNMAGENSLFPEEFYSNCADDILLQSTSVNDRELLIIYLKQSVHILEKSGIITKEDDNSIRVENGLSWESLYRRLFNSFWNRLEWKVIFPSSPEAADSLYEKREYFVDLLTGYFGSVNIEVLANDFFDLSEICPRNDYFMISFIDFYLLTWLRHFGIVEYASRNDDKAPDVCLTESGRTLLKSIS